MTAYLTDIDRKFLTDRHELPFSFKKSDQFIHFHIICRTSIKTLMFAKLLYNCSPQRCLSITISLHHVKDFVCM